MLKLRPYQQECIVAKFMVERTNKVDGKKSPVDLLSINFAGWCQAQFYKLDGGKAFIETLETTGFRISNNHRYVENVELI
jgi:hypothetical protein